MAQNKPQKESDILHALLEINNQLIIPIDLKKAIATILEKSSKLLNCESCLVFTLDEHSNTFDIESVKGFREDAIKKPSFKEGWLKIIDQVAAKRKTLIANDADSKIFFRIDALNIKSILAAPLISNDMLVGVLIVVNSKERAGFTNDDANTLLAIATQATIAILNAKLYQELKSLYISAVQSMAAAIDAKDPYTKGHSERVMNYSIKAGEKMGLSEDFIEDLKLAALMHDVGKIGIPESILLKPKELTVTEKENMNRHPLIGVRILESMEESYRFIPGIRDHHERYDGSGYPNKLKGEEISLQGRIIAVTDAFDAMVTERPYQKALKEIEAITEIKKYSGTRFDPDVVAAFVELFNRKLL